MTHAKDSLVIGEKRVGKKLFCSQITSYLMFIIWTQQKPYLFLKCIRNTSSSYWVLNDVLSPIIFGRLKNSVRVERLLALCVGESEHLLVSSQQCLTPRWNIYTSSHKSLPIYQSETNYLHLLRLNFNKQKFPWRMKAHGIAGLLSHPSNVFMHYSLSNSRPWFSCSFTMIKRIIPIIKQTCLWSVCLALAIPINNFVARCLIWLSGCISIGANIVYITFHQSYPHSS